jgi:hypothetical protein
MSESFSIMEIQSEHETIARKIEDFEADPKPEKHVSELINSLESVCLQTCRELKAELDSMQNLNA